MLEGINYGNAERAFLNQICRWRATGSHFVNLKMLWVEIPKTCKLGDERKCFALEPGSQLAAALCDLRA